MNVGRKIQPNKELTKIPLPGKSQKGMLSRGREDKGHGNRWLKNCTT